ncbi:chemotaxis response regulator protein-glutamate methylesterase [Sphingomonas sp. RP10(2022)]|uniref:Protein-glutamate methylesterase/protein-glutamine glutaminase n=1 Tax=Sphingomonas liriopis TaxID=2949094 RepID=A0A9X2HU76_9SPHN|nr:chemotaxis response regulator protein-glutamate methylesterase [Sphingomonas liriopis]MCP3735584.1 chemotaxis response regulator protein-glutamate methylesterase [Sphingomonas liriopis]
MTVRTLVVDDSPTMRAMVAHSLSQDAEIEVVGTADGPHSAREMIKSLNPDVITLDIEMPGMNGLDFLEKIMRLRPMPVVMLSTLTGRGAEATIRALELGAFDCYEKPKQAFGGGLGEGLTRLVKAAAKSRVRPRVTPVAPRVPADYVPRADAMIAIGSSTGGVETLIELLGGFPANCPPTVIVQHMPESYVPTFAARLDRLSAPTVSVARTGAPLEPGHIYVAPGGSHHCEITGGTLRRCRLVADEKMSGHRPSVDRLFLSVARWAGASAVGAILTGMGADGARGLKTMKDAGAMTIGQDEDSCVVYGMPAAAYQMGAVTAQLPLSRIAARLLAECRA